MKSRPKAAPPSLFGFTKEYAALRDILDQLIVRNGGKKFSPRPKVPGFEERWRRKDKALKDTVSRICGTG